MNHFCVAAAAFDYDAVTRRLQQIGATLETPEIAGAPEFRDPDGYAVELTCEMDQIGWDGVSRPSEQYRPAKSLEKAVANPVLR